MNLKDIGHLAFLLYLIVGLGGIALLTLLAVFYIVTEILLPIVKMRRLLCRAVESEIKGCIITKNIPHEIERDVSFFTNHGRFKLVTQYCLTGRYSLSVDEVERAIRRHIEKMPSRWGSRFTVVSSHKVYDYDGNYLRMHIVDRKKNHGYYVALDRRCGEYDDKKCSVILMALCTVPTPTSEANG